MRLKCTYGATASRGFTLVETCIGMVIIAMVINVLVRQVRVRAGRA